jgi:predicted O-linked N-acetylglucosamine transferase (SPINDLY family)
MDLAPPPRASYGLPEQGIVFGALAGHYKITPEMFASWMRILAATPGSVLWLREGIPTVQRNLRAAATAQDVDATRLIFAPAESLQRYFARWALVDLLLDTFPFGAHTTVNDALFCDVPVITRMGRSFASRASASQLHAVGMGGLAVHTQADYEALAIALAADTPRRQALAAQLRATRDTAPLFDMDRYTEAFGNAIFATWSALRQASSRLRA